MFPSLLRRDVFRAMLALTEPMSNGWGGGSHILVRMADGRVIVIDGGSEAPADAKSASQGSSLGGICSSSCSFFLLRSLLINY